MLIVESRSLEVYRNLAMEEYLMDEVRGCGPILFLWRSSCAVVMGKNQNPWRECRLDRMEKDGVPLARRISGGGTVYHDAGNLNYCVITDRESYREEQAYEIVLQALESFGIRAERSGKSNLSVDGLKFSGNAFAFRKGRAMHHGTLLLNTDLDRLGRYLGAMSNAIETHAVASVPAAVMNLGLETEALSAALRRSFERLYPDGAGSPCSENDVVREAAVEVLQRRQASPDWIFGATPRFSIEIDGRPVEVLKGIVQEGARAGAAFQNVAHSLFCLVD